MSRTAPTVAAKFTFVEAATGGGRTCLLSEMASPTGTWQPAAAMVDWAFALGPSLTPIGTLVDPGGPAVKRPTVAVIERADLPPAIAPRVGSLACAAGLDRRGRGGEG